MTVNQEAFCEACRQILARCRQTRRIDLLRDMPAETLALYLENELDDSLPTDWLAWLLEEL